ncbi:ABC transporter substrate-binding protein [Paenibacillus xerothermodurans]|uniref:ABC transporter substrate-binding protein n=2 Tax=Paenibacillus xerothermodurans TaxID=1977292 RepID=A0A2W1P1A3_PAEXE|nr:ABC transporter substrate-binding protein [Paenibacillus xerothermodurans]
MAGCSDQPDTGGNTSEEGGKLTSLTYWTTMTGQAAVSMKSYGEMEVYKGIESITGVKVNFQHPPQGQDAEQFNLMLTSGQLPDVIEYHWTSFPGGPEKAVKDGRIIKLNELIDQHAPNLKKVLESNPEWKKQVTTDDGSIVGFPFLRGDKKLQVYKGVTVRKDWLDKLGLQMPTTIDEWHTVLKAFKEQDPNGNGQADEIPIIITLGELNGSHAFIGAFGITNGFFQDAGKVKYGPLQPQYKEFLTLMNQWYKEGLLDKDYAATDGKLLDAKVTGHQIGALITNTGGGIGKYMGLMAGKDNHFTLSPAPYPTLNKGEKPELGQMDFTFNGRGAAISTSNKNPVETVKWLDVGYSEEGHMLFNFGKEGISYNLINGYPKYTEMITKNPDGLPMQQAMARHNRAGWDGPFVQDVRYIEQYAAIPEQQESLTAWAEPTNEKLMPLITPTKEESGTYASIMADINTYKDEMFHKFVMGAEPLSNFDAFTATLKSMGIDEALEIQQAALERYNKR